MSTAVTEIDVLPDVHYLNVSMGGSLGSLPPITKGLHGST